MTSASLVTPHQRKIWAREKARNDELRKRRAVDAMDRLRIEAEAATWAPGEQHWKGPRDL